MDFRQAGWGGGEAVKCGFLLSNISLFNAVLSVYPRLWLSGACRGGWGMFRGGLGKKLGPDRGGEDGGHGGVYVWESVCSAGQRGHGGGEGAVVELFIQHQR